MKPLGYILDFITIPIILISFCCALIFNIPGLAEICDQDAGFIFIGILLFSIVCIVFLFRSIILIFKKTDEKFRKKSLVIFALLLILSLGGLNKIIFISYFGSLKYKAHSIENEMIYIEFYENGRFFSEGFFSSCYEHITGTYEIIDQNVQLNYDQESEFISTSYIKRGDILINLGGKNDTLRIK